MFVYCRAQKMGWASDVEPMVRGLAEFIGHYAVTEDRSDGYVHLLKPDFTCADRKRPLRPRLLLWPMRLSTTPSLITTITAKPAEWLNGSIKSGPTRRAAGKRATTRPPGAAKTLICTGWKPFYFCIRPLAKRSGRCALNRYTSCLSNILRR